MSREELRANICRLVLQIENENVLEETLSFLTDSCEDEIIPGLPRTYEERMAAVDRGMEDYRNGHVYTTDELLTKHPEWKFDGQKQLISL